MDAGPRIAIDAMGGDTGPAAIVAGIARARRKDSSLQFILFGDEKIVREELKKHDRLDPGVTVHHAPESIASTEKPSQAIRRAKTTSMGLAINAVKDGQADAAVSGGNTGALMAISKLALRTMPGIDRPALAALLPTLGDNDVVMLDLGANTECDARNLVQFAIMGAAYSRVVTGREAPRVRLLNIGTEEIKGTDSLRVASDMLKGAAGALSMQFDGFTEADKLCRGDVDVVVSDGFSGNIALKAVEGTARFVADLLKRSFTSSLRSKFGFLVSRPATELLKHHLDPNNHNGGVFLGLNGIVVKSHGSANAVGIANAVAVTARLLEEDVTERITADLARVGADSLKMKKASARAESAAAEGGV